MLGASPWRVWREIELPIIGRALLVAALFAFSVSMGEFGATLLIARPEYPDHAGGDLSACWASPARSTTARRWP